MKVLCSLTVGLIVLGLPLTGSAQHAERVASYFSENDDTVVDLVSHQQSCGCANVWNEDAGCGASGCGASGCDSCGASGCDSGCAGGCDSCGCETGRCGRCRCWTMYGAGIVGASFMRAASAGFNTFGGFPNADSGNDEVFTAGGALGITLPGRMADLRFEVEGRGRNLFDTTTDAFFPVGVYNVDLEDIWSATVNAWVDIPLTQRLEAYGGGGVGMGGYHMRVTDGVVQGEGGDSNFAYQLGAGLNYVMSNNLTVDIGYRFVDLGRSSMGLSAIGPGFPAGNYTMDVTTHEVVVTLRYNRIGDLFRSLR